MSFGGHVLAYIQCQRSMVQCHTITPLSTFGIPETRFDRIHIDLVGPLPPSSNYTYILTCIYVLPIGRRPSPSLTLLPRPSLATSSAGGSPIWCALYHHNRLWSSILVVPLVTAQADFGVCSSQTASYHPNANGLIEHINRELKAKPYATDA